MKVSVPRKLRFLLDPHRYKISLGGRGGGKSWTYARCLIARAMQRATRVLCAREIQKSIKESVHKLLTDQIDALGVSDFFTITEHSILCKNKSEFIFEGLFRNVNRIKSLEGIDVVWVEEAESVSEDSWQLLIPTIRKPESEIWITFNPKYEDDATYQRFVVNPPADCVSAVVNYDDNPWFPEVLRREMENDKARNFVMYEHVWLGKPIGAGARIWHNFDSAVHVRDFDVRRIAACGNCFMAMDPHSKFYPFCVWAARVPKDDRKKEFFTVVYNEWPTHDNIGGYYSDLRKTLYYTGTIEDMARQIYVHDTIGHESLTVQKRFIDTRFAKGAGGENWSTQTVGVVQEFAKSGLVFDMPAERVIDVQRDVIIKAMDYNKLISVSAFNCPDLIVMPHCRNMIQSLTNHRCVEASEKEDEKYKDPSDALRILFAGLSDWRYKDPDAQKSVRPTNITNYAVTPQGWLA
jgi:hypothetical protein